MTTRRFGYRLVQADCRNPLARLAVEEGAVEEAGLSIQILTPGDFIRQIYPLQEAYAYLPPRRG